MREGLVRMVAGSVPSANLGALAAFLLTGQPQQAVVPVATEPVPAPLAPGAPAGTVTEEQAVAAGSAGPAAPGSTGAKAETTASAPGAPRAEPASPSAQEAPPAGRATKRAEGRPAPAALEAEAAIRAPGRWMRPAAYVAGSAAVLLGGFAVWQGFRASARYDDAAAMVRPDGSFQPGADPARYAQLVSDGDAAKRAAVASAAAAALTAVTGGVVWLLSRDPPPAPGLAFRF